LHSRTVKQNYAAAEPPPAPADLLRIVPMKENERAPGAASQPVTRRVETATKNHDRVRDRREQLIDAAVTVFSQKGFHDTTVRDIGRAAGLTQGTIYNYVRSKEDILYLVCDQIVTQYLHNVRHALAVNGPPTARIHAALEGIARVMVEHKSGILLLYHESHNLSHESRRSIVIRVDEFITSFEQLLNDVPAAHPFPTRNLRSLANIVTFLPTIFALRGWGFAGEVPESECVQDLVDFMAAGLRLSS
jgi:AcrR family transcriptional regulator